MIDMTPHKRYSRRMTTTKKAKLILIQLEALKEGNFENRSIEEIGLINEILKDAKSLAEAVLADENAYKKAA